jgi:ubiquinone/menaquinone biosynthesis C-methylase UbiE
VIAGEKPVGSAGDRTSFGPLAATYDELRPADENWWELFELLVREADLVGRRVLDVGCGTGRLAAALADRGSRVWGVELSPAMAEQARRRGVNVKVAPAERLPFKDGWFERATLWLVAHLIDRPAAFAELARVLDSDGRVAVATFDPAHFDRYYLNRLFPTLERTDRARFPEPGALVDELAAAGFTTRLVALTQQAELGRDEALERIRGRFISTLRLLDEAEFADGLARAERELPERIPYELDWSIAVADRI